MRTVTVKFDSRDGSILEPLARETWDRGDTFAYTTIRTILASLAQSGSGVAWVELSVTAAQGLACPYFPQIQEALDGVREEPERQDRPSVRKSRRFL